MAPSNERDLLAPGYTVLELRHDAAGLEGDAGQRLDDLERECDAAEAELRQREADLAALDARIRGAVQSEDAPAVTSAWADKHHLIEDVDHLRARAADLRRERDTELARAWQALREERQRTAQLEQEHDQLLDQLAAAARRLADQAQDLAGKRAELRRQHDVVDSRVRAIEGRGRPREMAAVLPLRRPRVSPLPEGLPADAQAARKWSVYDPDAGRIVEDMHDLLRLLARWYPALRTEEERVRAFLTMPNAAPMPDRLRTELREAGYLPPESA